MEGSCYIQGFWVENSHGKIEWQNEVDLTDVNLNEAISIDLGSVEIYPQGTFKPKIGYKLNQRAKVTLNNIKPKYNKDQKKLINELGEKGEESISKI